MLPVDDAVARRYPPLVTWGLIAINVIVFLYELSLGEARLIAFIERYGLVPARIFDAPHGLGPRDLFPFVSNMFLHAGWAHLLLNMWTLWIFGPAVEDRLGAKRYMGFYLALGLAASISHALFNPHSTLPALGASGAISGVLGAYVRMFPYSRLIVVVPVLFFPFFFEMPAIVFAMFWLMMQIIPGLAALIEPSTVGGVAWWAHIGGFAAGWFLVTHVRRPPHKHRPFFADETRTGHWPDGRRINHGYGGPWG